MVRTRLLRSDLTATKSVLIYFFNTAHAVWGLCGSRPAPRGHPPQSQRFIAEQTKKLMAKKREELFLKNGSLLLEKLVSYFNGKSNPIRSYSVQELEQATDNYSSFLIFDKWIYFEWYKGSLQGRVVSVRKFHEIGDDLLERVIKEITFATKMSAHKNVLKLLGCCLETQIPILVYEFPTNGVAPLSDITHPSGDGTQRQCLPGKNRLRIAWDIANVIAYLHTAFPRPIIHRDVTLSFFFLDQDCVPKLSNFFLSIVLPDGKKHVVDEVRGTMGFIAPEYMMTGMFTEKVDVYSYGKLVLELLTGKKIIELGRLADDEGGFLLPDYVKSHVANHGLDGFVDAGILPKGGEVHEERQMLAIAKLALRCIMNSPEHRPIGRQWWRLQKKSGEFRGS